MAGLDSHLYWDACVFVAYLNEEQDAYGPYIEHIAQYLRECKERKCVIYTSTISIAEITDSCMKKNVTYGNFTSFLNDYQSLIIPIEATPNIMRIAASIKGLVYAKTGGRRVVGTGDAIHLASALALDDTYGVGLSKFHTFDAGNSKGVDGKAVPILGFETWCEACKSDLSATKIMNMPRERPSHPSPELPHV